MTSYDRENEKERVIMFTNKAFTFQSIEFIIIYHIIRNKY